jgi:hypothetical protein
VLHSNSYAPPQARRAVSHRQAGLTDHNSRAGFAWLENLRPTVKVAHQVRFPDSRCSFRFVADIAHAHNATTAVSLSNEGGNIRTCSRKDVVIGSSAVDLVEQLSQQSVNFLSDSMQGVGVLAPMHCFNSQAPCSRYDAADVLQSTGRSLKGQANIAEIVTQSGQVLDAGTIHLSGMKLHRIIRRPLQLFAGKCLLV